jgi:hypothetical protein
VARSAVAHETAVARTIDAERCGCSFEAQVLALLRRHCGADVDIAPSPAEVLALAKASLADVSDADARVS